MATTKLAVYNEALRLLGDTRLDSVTDVSDIRLHMDDAYASVVDYVGALAPWRFALATAQLFNDGGAAITGYTHRFAVITSAVIRITGVYKAVASTGNEYPIDFRLQGVYGYANVDPIIIRYISTSVRTEASWPELFTKAVAARLAFEIATRATGMANLAEGLLSLWDSSIAAAQAREANYEDPWYQRQLDGSFRTAALTILEQGFWDFAMASSTLSADGSPTPFPGFTNSFTLPADHKRTHAIYTIDSRGRECPVDAREHGSKLSCDTAPITIRYLSSTSGLDASKWPESFRRTVAAYLGIDIGDGGVTRDESGRVQRPLLWPDYLQKALLDHSVPPNQWLRSQLSGEFRRALENILQKANWRFALENATIAKDSVADARLVAGFTNTFLFPADHFRTRGIYVLDGARERPVAVREHEGIWSADVTSLRVYYTSSDTGLDTTKWPEDVLRVVAAYLGIEAAAQTRDGQTLLGWPEYLASAAERHAIPDDPWLQYQLSGEFEQARNWLLQNGQWGFATKTAELTANTPADLLGTFSYDFDKPADWFSTIRIYTIENGHERDLDYLDEDGRFHADCAPIYVRYVASTLGQDPTVWREVFDTALLALLALRRAEADPRTPGAVLARRREAYSLAIRESKAINNQRERPTVNMGFGTLASARFGGSSRWSSKEQG